MKIDSLKIDISNIKMPDLIEIIKRSPKRENKTLNISPKTTNTPTTTQHSDDTITTDLINLRNSLELKMIERERTIDTFFTLTQQNDDDEEYGFADCQF